MMGWEHWAVLQLGSGCCVCPSQHGGQLVMRDREMEDIMVQFPPGSDSLCLPGTSPGA